jgi:hypothetical protein
MQAMADIGKKDGLKGYWKGNLPQVLDVPYHPWFILLCCADSYPSPINLSRSFALFLTVQCNSSRMKFTRS